MDYLLLLPLFIAVRLSNRVDLILVVMVIGQRAKNLCRLQIVPFGQNVLDRHPNLIVVANDVGNTYASTLNDRLTAQNAFDAHNVRIFG